jgi:hypothetical protein
VATEIFFSAFNRLSGYVILAAGAIGGGRQSQKSST